MKASTPAPSHLSNWLVGLDPKLIPFERLLRQWKKPPATPTLGGLKKDASLTGPPRSPDQCRPFSAGMLPELLKDALYYPACGTDYKPLPFAVSAVTGFVYADNGRTITAEQRVRRLHEFLERDAGLGFEMLKIETLTAEQLGLPPGFGEANPEQPPHATLVVLQSAPDEDGVPRRICVLLLGIEGIRAYENLFVRRKMRPLILVVVRASDTDFRSADGSLAIAVTENRAGKPPWFLEEVHPLLEVFPWRRHYPKHRPVRISPSLCLWVPVG